AGIRCGPWPCCARWPMKECCAAPGTASRQRPRSCRPRSMTWWFAASSTCRRQRWSCCRSRRGSAVPRALPAAPRAPPRRRPRAEVVGQLSDAFDAQLLDEADDRVVFRHQLVHDAIYQHMPPPARRLLHREAAVALMAAGADRLDVADHLMLGAERGDEQAFTWLRDGAREAAAQAPLVAVELIRRAEALLPGGHGDADLVSSEVVQALLRAGKVAEASARAEAVLARRHATEVDTPLRVALVAA